MNAKARTGLKLVAQAGREKSAAELRFFMLNRTLIAVPYDRASLWRIDGKPRLLGVSGVERPDAAGEFARAWRKAVAASGGPVEAKRFSSASGDAAGKALAGIVDCMEALWLPLPRAGMALALERWRHGFDDKESSLLADIAAGYDVAWSAVAGRRRWRPAAFLAKLAVLAAVAAALVFVRLPLRVVAPCEVVAKNPYLVATPMDGVIRELLVEPGQAVEKGTPLALYEEDVQEGDLEVARRQADAAEAELASLVMRSLAEPALRERANVLGARLEQERARLDLAEKRLAKMRVAAPAAGTAVFEDPDAWRGRPVSVGERMLWLVEPGRTHVRIWLPQTDRIDFDFSRPVGVYLDAYGGDLRPARLARVADSARMAPTGRFAFPAEAEWEDGAPVDAHLGLTGTAVLYGPVAPLWWWLARKPVGGLRQWLGL